MDAVYDMFTRMITKLSPTPKAVASSVKKVIDLDDTDEEVESVKRKKEDVSQSESKKKKKKRR